MTIVIMCVLV